MTIRNLFALLFVGMMMAPGGVAEESDAPAQATPSEADPPASGNEPASGEAVENGSASNSQGNEASGGSAVTIVVAPPGLGLVEYLCNAIDNSPAPVNCGGGPVSVSDPQSGNCESLLPSVFFGSANFCVPHVGPSQNQRPELEYQHTTICVGNC